jgi:hypothetical protein
MPDVVRIDPPNCSIIAKGQHMHMHAQSNGKVIFKSHFLCDLTFKTIPPNNPVFKLTTLHLDPDVDVQWDVICKNGRTEVTIDKCQYALDLSDPTDIIVP